MDGPALFAVDGNDSSSTIVMASLCLLLTASLVFSLTVIGLMSPFVICFASVILLHGFSLIALPDAVVVVGGALKKYPIECVRMGMTREICLRWIIRRQHFHGSCCHEFTSLHAPLKHPRHRDSWPWDPHSRRHSLRLC